MQVEQIKYYICVGCGHLHSSSECTSCWGCAEKEKKCLDELNSHNMILQGHCPVCASKILQKQAA